MLFEPVTGGACFRFLHLAEMMKPSTSGSAAPTQQNGVITSSDEISEYYPHIGESDLALFARELCRLLVIQLD
jgi:hypothetical protein